MYANMKNVNKTSEHSILWENKGCFGFSRLFTQYDYATPDTAKTKLYGKREYYDSGGC